MWNYHDIDQLELINRSKTLLKDFYFLINKRNVIYVNLNH